MTPRSAAPTPSPPTESAADAVVDAAGDGDYESVQAAIDDSPTDGSGYVVYIRAGTYKEQLEVGDKRSNVTLVGEDVAETVLTWDENAEDAGGTTDSASVTVLADGFRAYDLTFQNTARPIAQKVALLAEGDRHVYANCRFLSHQDTLYTRESGNRQYFRDCYVEGTTDFVFGDASAVFDRCEVFCLEGASHVTAANTLPEYDVGLVFKHCRVHGDADEGSVDLGRPWGKHARTVFVDCHLGEVIAPYGWSNWGDPSKEDTVYYAECANTGPGFTPEQRVEWAHVLAPERAGEFRDIFADWEPIEG
ncbi:MAG: pectinesterase family protein [Halobacteriaceae archaeon]